MPEKKSIARNVHQGLHDGGVPQKRYEEALLWAFGPNYRKVRIKQWYRHWNKRHTVFKLKKNEKVRLMLKRIGEQYVKISGA